MIPANIPPSARLVNCRLYVLVDGRNNETQFRGLISQLLEAEVDLLQLRDKRLADRELLQRARILRQMTRETPTLFIMNDRPDLAVLADADGVHVGQEELTVQDVRQILGPHRLIGVSTHTVPQVRQAIADGADYIGCGPTFPSVTKAFPYFSGLTFLRQAASQTTIQAYAIGGIRPDNLNQVIESGFQRVAVGAAIVDSADPARSAAMFRDALAADK
jgi:thiamine-phosphate pyrophosphorylase